ncbi:MAG: 16S rRNA (adenine(1518)-N(6)/adenine(1519)-N(6))-dimethyltransferase RsmA [Hyphomicrobiaceae bacterium]
MSLDDLPPLREVIARLGLSARKSLGQNFILDLNLTGRIARSAGPLDGLTVVEVGPGPGGLTRALLKAGAARVVAVERDERCLPALEEIAAVADGRLEIVMGDATEVDLGALAGSPAVIVANLPYSVGTELLVGWLAADPWPPWYLAMTLMFQKEVGERIVAEPGSKAYGRLSVLAQWRAVPRILFNLPASAFTPPPKVASVLVRLEPRSEPLEVGATAALERVTAAAFGQRRKMLRASLRGVFADAEAVLGALGIAPERRAETLSVAEFAALARRLHAGGGRA